MGLDYLKGVRSVPSLEMEENIKVFLQILPDVKNIKVFLQILPDDKNIIELNGKKCR